MSDDGLPADIKRTSALRRLPPLEEIRFRSEPGTEGDLCVFELQRDGRPITVEAPTGRLMTIVPGDLFLGTPGHRAARRWIVGGVPAGGLVPGGEYWVLSNSESSATLSAARPRRWNTLAAYDTWGWFTMTKARR